MEVEGEMGNLHFSLSPHQTQRHTKMPPRTCRNKPHMTLILPSMCAQLEQLLKEDGTPQ